MNTKYEIDKLDLEIIELLQRDARCAYLEIARKLDVSGGTIHQRMDKLKKMRIVEGSKLSINYQKLGFGVTVFLGINISLSKNIPKVINRLSKLAEITELHFTTGNYALMAKIHCTNIEHYNRFLQNYVQNIEEITSTQSNICLETAISKHLDLTKFTSIIS